jgi:hypothetical protein
LALLAAALAMSIWGGVIGDRHSVEN